MLALPPSSRDEQVDRRRMAERDARVLAEDVRADRLARRGVGDDDAVAVEHQHRQARMLEQVAHAGARQLDAFERLRRRLGVRRRNAEPERADPHQHRREHQPADRRRRRSSRPRWRARSRCRHWGRTVPPSGASIYRAQCYRCQREPVGARLPALGAVSLRNPGDHPICARPNSGVVSRGRSSRSSDRRPSWHRASSELASP